MSESLAPGALLSCGDTVPPREGIGTGYATAPDGRTLCYFHADQAQREDMRRDGTVTGYVYGDERHVTTWTGGALLRVTAIQPSPRNARRYVYAIDTDGTSWSGSGPLESGDYVTMRRRKA